MRAAGRDLCSRGGSVAFADMSTPEVALAWSTFAETVDVTGMSDADWDHLAAYVAALDKAGLALSAAEDNLIDVGSRDGAPEFLTGELMAGVDVGLRVLAHQRKPAPAVAPLSPAAVTVPPVTAAPAAQAAPAIKPSAADAGSELSDAEKKALGLA